MTFLNENREIMRETLITARSIAVVGHSDKAHRASYQIAQFLRDTGYTVYPVNPTVREINGEPSYPSLAKIPEPIDIVNVFRRSEHVAGIVDEAIAIGAKTIWTQLGVIDYDAARKAIDAGLRVAMDRCIKIELVSLEITRVN